jgi:hypothetical protein
LRKIIEKYADPIKESSLNLTKEIAKDEKNKQKKNFASQFIKKSLLNAIET